MPLEDTWVKFFDQIEAGTPLPDAFASDYMTDLALVEFIDVFTTNLAGLNPNNLSIKESYQRLEDWRSLFQQELAKRRHKEPLTFELSSSECLAAQNQLFLKKSQQP